MAKTSDTEPQDEAAAVEAQQEADATASQRRAREAARATQKKTYPEGALPPSQKVAQDGTKSYAVQRLIREADSFMGHPSHVVAGALHDCEHEYLTIEDAADRVEDWLARPVA